jgi:outer membrane cobalamin receptor
MRLLRVLAGFVILGAAASAAELKIKVVDPQSAAVGGARVELLVKGNTTPAAIEITSPEGTVTFHGLGAESGPGSGSHSYWLRVLGPGFAEQRAEVPPSAQGELTLQLRIATAAQTVVVTATRTPVPSEAANASVATLSAARLETMQPVAASEALRFLPGAVIASQGRRGGLASLFVRGGDSRYNKVIVDGVPLDEPGGTFDFGVVPLAETERLEFVRGAQSTLYGSDAMTSVVQTWTRAGSTPVPELRLGADGGTFETAHGYLSAQGARGHFDYNLFGDQFNTNGQGSNDQYSNSLQGANLGVSLSDAVALRLRIRHSDAFTGVQGEWNFNGAALMPPDSDQWQRQNNLLAGLELSVTGPSRGQHRLAAYEYSHRRTNVDTVIDPGRRFDTPFHAIADINRAGFEYQGDYMERNWTRTTLGYEFEDENGFVGDLNAGLFHGLRLNHALYGQQLLSFGRLSLAAGARFVHNQTFGNKAVPRVALTLQALKGGEIFSGTRLRFSYATGIKEARFDEAFASGPTIIANPNLKAEENRAFEAGFEQSFLGGKYALSALYYNHLFRNQIDFAILDFTNFTGQYENIDKSIAHGVEVEFNARPLSRLSLDGAYNYTSTQILEQPFAFDSLHQPGQPLLRRPKHSGSLLLTYLGRHGGANLGGSFVGRRPDSDFLGFNVDHAAGYARLDIGGWYGFTSRITAYANVENVGNKHYQEVVGYPALAINFRAGMRFRIGGE